MTVKHGTNACAQCTITGPTLRRSLRDTRATAVIITHDRRAERA